MKREHCDPVLEQLHALINGHKVQRCDSPEPPPQLPPQLPPPLPTFIAHDPVLAQLDALINGAPAIAPATEPDVELSGPPGLFREFGGVRGWMELHTNPKRITPPPSAVRMNVPFEHTS